jgi:hypothetical protein
MTHEGAVALSLSGSAGDAANDAWFVVCARWLPLPAGGGRGGGAVVPRYGLSYRDVEELLASTESPLIT